MAEKTTFIDISSGDGLALTQLENDIAYCLQAQCGILMGLEARSHAIKIRRYLSDRGYAFEIPIVVQEPSP